MAHLVPSLEQINALPKALEPGEKALMHALLDILDDDWTIYVQPFLNGLQPDIIIFSEQAGLGIFEVKDWNLDTYQVGPNGRWSVYDAAQGGWQRDKVRCPLTQVEHYKKSIIKYEMPELEAEIALDENVYALIATFVYFHCHTTKEAIMKTAAIRESHNYVSVFGHDWLDAQMLPRLLRQQNLLKGSRFTGLMQRSEMHDRLRNALSYAEHGRLEVDDILFNLTAKQKQLLANTPEKKRVIGSAGSGKTLIVARKAVNAALDGRKALVVCFNITMANYLNEVVRRLARYKSKDGADVGRLILVRHYHRMFPDGELDDHEVIEMRPFDVILIDEAQDFSREWLLQLYDLGHAGSHIMLLEDDRQNLYDVDVKSRAAVPGISGPPHKLTRSFRINAEIGTLANRLISLSTREFESGELEPATLRQSNILRPVWYCGTANSMLVALKAQMERLANQSDGGALADIAILVCTYEDGWAVCDQLDTLRLPYICSFESREEHDYVSKMYEGEKRERRLDDLRRGRKMAFRMRTGRIKVCTIHSFKGWELRRVLVLFNPDSKQFEVRVPLLYTAITRSQESLYIFNAELKSLAAFGRVAASEGLLTVAQS